MWISLASRRQLSRIKNRSKLRDLRRSHRLARFSIPLSTRLSPQRTMSTISHDENAKRFTTEVDGYRAELDYTVAGSVMTITHTGVPQAIGGRGIAADLMRAALNVADASGWSVNPACSYAAAYMAKHARDPAREHIEDLLDEALEESFPASDSPSVGGSN
jgi:predicted GNAT family acetyltransferase